MPDPTFSLSAGADAIFFADDEGGEPAAELHESVSAEDAAAMAAAPELRDALRRAIDALGMINDDTPEAQSIIEEGRGALELAATSC